MPVGVTPTPIVVHIRSCRVATQFGREDRDVWRSRPVITTVLYNVHVRPDAVTRSRQENSTSGFQLLPICQCESLVVGIRLYTVFTCEARLECHARRVSPCVREIRPFTYSVPSALRLIRATPNRLFALVRVQRK